MDNLSNYAKEISAILGCVSAIAAVFVAISGKARGYLRRYFFELHDTTGERQDIDELKVITTKQTEQIAQLINTSEQQKDQINKLVAASEQQKASIQTLSDVVTLVQTLIENHVTGETNENRRVSDKLDYISKIVEASGEFTRIQISKEVGDIFNKYNSTKRLPAETWTYIENMSKIYIQQLGGNSLAAKLLKEMENWEVENVEADQ